MPKSKKTSKAALKRDTPMAGPTPMEVDRRVRRSTRRTNRKSLNEKALQAAAIALAEAEAARDAKVNRQKSVMGRLESAMQNSGLDESMMKKTTRNIQRKRVELTRDRLARDNTRRLLALGFSPGEIERNWIDLKQRRAAEEVFNARSKAEQRELKKKEDEEKKNIEDLGAMIDSLAMGPHRRSHHHTKKHHHKRHKNTRKRRGGGKNSECMC